MLGIRNTMALRNNPGCGSVYGYFGRIGFQQINWDPDHVFNMGRIRIPSLFSKAGSKFCQSPSGSTVLVIIRLLSEWKEIIDIYNYAAAGK